MNNGKKMLTFDLDKKDFKIKELISGDFLSLEVFAINDDYPNRNNSHFTLESLENAIPTCYNKPVLGAFNSEIGPMGDFEGHNDNGLHYDAELDELYYDYTSSDSEIPLGMIRESDSVSVVFDKRTQKNWLKLTCCLWCKYNFKAIKSLLKSRKGKSKVSVEIEVLQSHEDENGIEIIDKFALMGFTILGEKVSEGIENAHLSVIDLMENAAFQKKSKALCYAYTALENYKDLKDSAIDNEKKEDIKMDQNEQEGGNNKNMLTYNAKLKLLDGYISEHFREQNDNCPCVWVCDLDDNYVYFCWNDIYYRAEYSISESEVEGEQGNIEVALDDKEQVVSSWNVFQEKLAKDDSLIEETNENLEFEEVDVKDSKENEDCSVEKNAEESDEKVEETENVKTEESEEEKAVEESEKKMTEVEIEEEKVVNEKVEEDMTEIEEVEKQEANSEKEAEEQSEFDDNNQEAEKIETQAEDVCLNNESEDNAEKTMDEDENGNDQDENPDEDEDEDSDEAEDSNEEEDVDDIDEIYEEVKTIDEQSFSNVNLNISGTVIALADFVSSYNSLQNDYQQLQKKYEAIMEANKKKEMESLIKTATDFINSDSEVDEDSKKSYIKQVTEKCESYELDSEESVMKFTKSLLAMYYYDHRTIKHEEVDFSMSLERHIEEKPLSKNKLKDAIDKLSRI